MEDILLHVYRYLSLNDIYQCMQVDKLFYRASRNPSLWFQLLEAEYKAEYPELKKDTLYETYRICYLFDEIANIFKGTHFSIVEFKKSTRLGLTHKHLTFMPRGIFESINLIDLDLSVNMITTILPEINILTNLQILHLEYNRLTGLPKEISGLTNLQTLLVHHNQLNSIPKEIGKLKKLKNLNLNCNNLTNIPKEIGQLKNLEELNLHCNHLTNIPTEIGNITSLKTLILTNNNLKVIPAKIIQMRSLKKLDIEMNPLASKPKDTRKIMK